MVTSRGRRKFTRGIEHRLLGHAWGWTSPSWMTGMLDAEYLITSGGRMPGGSWRNCACSIATTCAMAVGMLAFG